MTIPDNLAGKIFLTLFALLFAVGFTAGGLVAGVMPMYKQLSGWWQASSYVPVPASVVSAKLESHRGKSTTYRAVAEFRYEYQGRSYSSHVLDLASGGSDNISDYQENLFQQLQQARNNAAPVTLWVNPQQPGQAVYNRSIRWMMVIFLIPFALLFPAIGLGAWWVIWRIWTHREPQFSNESAPGPLLIPGDRAGLIALAMMSAFWNLLSWPIAIVFLAGAHTAPWWVSLLISIFPSIGLVLLFTLWKAWRAQRRIGKPVLALIEAGVPGSFPLQGQIQFDPALGMLLDTSELTHDVSVSVEYVRENRRGKNTEVTTIWHGQAVQTQLARGAERLNFKMDLPESLPPAATPASSLMREYWQVVLETLGGKVNFRIPPHAVGMARSSSQHETQPQPAGSMDARALKMASRVRWMAKAAIFLFVGYVVWVAVNEFALPMHRSAQNNSSSQSQSATQISPAERSQLPKIHAPFLLDSLSGNGFGVVARSAGKMEIGDNTLQLYPESIELRSYSSCASDCPVIHAVEYSLTREGAESFSIVAESVPISVQQSLPDIASLAVSIPAAQLPIRLNFKDREALAGLRLTLEIRGELMSDGKLTEASWYTHVEPFPTVLGQEPASLAPADDIDQRQIQAQQAVLAGRSADLQQLLEEGVDADIRDAGGETMLMRAANRGDLSSVKMLLAHGAQVNASTPIDKDRNGAHTALHAAMRQDAVNVVDALIKAGANPQAEANQVWTPMHYAAYRGAVQSIRYLHQHGVGIDVPFKGARGSTPLMLAAQYEQVPTIRLLLELGADQKRKDIYGEDACGYARFFNKAASKQALGCQ